jgi:kanamycin nucleotidyltransferase
LVWLFTLPAEQNSGKSFFMLVPASCRMKPVRSMRFGVGAFPGSESGIIGNERTSAAMNDYRAGSGFGLTHDERVSLAGALAERAARQAGEHFVLAGLVGSTVRGLDTPWSDLDLVCFLRGSRGAKGRHFLLRGVAVGYWVEEVELLEQILTHPQQRWPYLMGLLTSLQVLRGDPAHRERWLEMGRACPPEAFRQAIHDLLPDMVMESFGRILSAKLRGREEDVNVSAIEVLLEMRTLLCLLNQSWVFHDYLEGIRDSFRFSKLPQDYSRLAPALWSARSANQAIPLATELVENFWRLLEGEGFSREGYERELQQYLED